MWGMTVVVVATGRSAFDLQGDMVDAKGMLQGVRRGIDEVVMLNIVWAHQVRGQRYLTAAQGPDMQVMD